MTSSSPKSAPEGSGPSPAAPGSDSFDVASRRVLDCLQRIERREPTLQAFVHVAGAQAMSRAAALDAQPVDVRGPLHGVPLAVKEVYQVRDMPWSAGSPVHRNRRGVATAPLVAALERAGAVTVGITASSEFAIAELPATTHPLDASRSPGASSSGSAAAVGAGLVPLALGTQTLGSIIRPAAYCGVVGFKPGFGRYDMQGIEPLCSELDHAGLLASSAALLARVDDVLAADAAGASRLRGACIVSPWFDEALSAAVLDALRTAESRLQALVPAWRRTAVPDWIARCEATVAHTLLLHGIARHHGAVLQASPPGSVSPQLRRLLDDAHGLRPSQLAQARSRHRDLAEALQEWLRPGEVALMAATVDVAPPRAQGSGSRAPQRLWSLAGMPALCMPVGGAGGALPIAVQCVARRGEDRLLLEFAMAAQALLAPSAREGDR